MQFEEIAVNATDTDLLEQQMYQKHFNSVDTAVFVFTDTYRQNQDLPFKEQVSKLRRINVVRGCIFTKEDYAYWCQRDYHTMPEEERDGFRSQDTLYLFDVNSKKNPKVHSHNTERFCEMHAANGDPVALSAATHSCPEAKNATENVAQGLQDQLYLMKGMRVMLRKNLLTAAGLVNGSLGVVHEILRDPESKRFVALVDFPTYKGPQAFVNCPKKVVPIVFATSEFQVGRSRNGKVQNGSRDQLPLVMSWATSIHKSQGMTVGPGKLVAINNSDPCNSCR